MKRIPDLEREILLAIEADDHNGTGFIDLSGIDGYSDQQKGYHVLLLYEAGLIEAVDAGTTGDSFAWEAVRLTMTGHQYLDTIRDEEIWRQTKEGAEKVGSWGLETLSQLARGFIRTQVKRLTGEDVDV